MKSGRHPVSVYISTPPHRTRIKLLWIGISRHEASVDLQTGCKPLSKPRCGGGTLSAGSRAKCANRSVWTRAVAARTSLFSGETDTFPHQGQSGRPLSFSGVGPIRNDKTFIFGDYEGLRDDTSGIQNQQVRWRTDKYRWEKTSVKQTYLVSLEVVVPAAVSVRIVAETEWEAAKGAIKIAESLGPSRCEIDAHDFLKVEAVTEITPLDPDDPGRKVWKKDEIENLVGRSAVFGPTCSI